MMNKQLVIRTHTNPNIEIEPAVFIGDFSLDTNREFCEDSKQNLKFLKNYDWKSEATMVHFDLNKDINGRISKDMDKLQKENIIRILHWICANKEKLYVEKDNIQRIFPDFVCLRGRLSQILNTPYANNEEWMFDVVKYRGTIYISEVETENKRESRLGETAVQKKMSAWGFKFEQQILGEDGPLNENPEYCCVFKTMLAGHSIMCAAEVDAADFEMYNRKKDDLRSFVEFKTNKLLTYDKAQYTFRRYKARQWWAQSAIIGIPEIICGFRTEEGVVTHTKHFNVTQLPFFEGTKFDTNVMLNFLGRFLTWLKVVIEEDTPAVYRIHRMKYGSCVYLSMSPCSSFITQEYTDEVFTPLKSNQD